MKRKKLYRVNYHYGGPHERGTHWVCDNHVGFFLADSEEDAERQALEVLGGSLPEKGDVFSISYVRRCVTAFKKMADKVFELDADIQKLTRSRDVIQKWMKQP